MYVCEQCKSQIGEQKPQTGRSFPIFSVVGGVIGAFCTAITGMLVLVPASVIVGAVGDTLRRCSVCNREIKEHEPCYQAMESFDNDLHGQTFRPVSKPLPQSSDMQQAYQPSFQPAFRPLQPLNQIRQGHQFDSQPKEFERSSPIEFVFDRIEGKLVSLDSPESISDHSGIESTSPIMEKKYISDFKPA
jgi:hypothetical protein